MISFPMKKHQPGIILFSAMAAVLLMKLGVIRKLFELSLWPDLTYYFGLGFQPGVLLPIFGSVLTQVSGIPLVGVVLVLASLGYLSHLMARLHGDPISSHLPSVCMFLFLTGFDYSLYTFKSQGLLFSQTLGLIFACLIILGWKHSKRFGGLWPFGAVLLGYPRFGAYAVLAAIAVAIGSIKERKWLSSVSAIVSGALIPLLYTNLFFTHIDTRYTFLAGLPYMDFVDNYRRFIPLALAMVSVCVLPSLKPMKQSRPVVSYSLAAVLLAGIFVLPYWNRNFHVEIGMQHAIEKNDWDKALKLAGRSEHPTRVIVMYRNIALMNKGQLCDRMFTFPNASVDIDTPAQISQTEVCASTVFFYNGLVNYSTRWAWEMSMMFQRTLERYKYQAKVALFTGKENPELVRKYLRIIGRNLYQKRWVERYSAMLDDPDLLGSDPEYRMFKQLDSFEEVKYMSSAVVENTILNHFLLQEHPEGVMLDASLAAAMTAKDIDMFWYFYDQLLQSGRRIPTHVGEAAILFAYISRNQDEIDAVASELGGPQSPTVRRFINFSTDASAGNTEACRAKYGDTYWYYSYFVKSLTTN